MSELDRLGTAKCLCSEIDPSDRPCIECDADALLADVEAGRLSLDANELAFARELAERG